MFSGRTLLHLPALLQLLLKVQLRRGAGERAFVRWEDDAVQHQTVCRRRERHRARALECAVAQRVLQLLQAELTAACVENKRAPPSASSVDVSRLLSPSRLLSAPEHASGSGCPKLQLPRAPASLGRSATRAKPPGLIG